MTTTARGQYLAGRPELAWAITVDDLRLNWTVQQHVVTGALTESDGHHDVGGMPLPWGDSTVMDDHIVRVWSETVWGGNAQWYGVTDAGPVYAWTCGTPTAYVRPGLSPQYIWFLDGQYLVRQPVTAASGAIAMAGAATNLDLGANLAYDAACVCVLDDNSAVVVGWRAPLLWAAYVTTGGLVNVSVLEQNTAYRWYDILCAAAARLDATHIVLGAPQGPDGRALAYQGYLTGGLMYWSQPRSLLATPNAELGRRLWVYGMSVWPDEQAVPRVWCTLYNDIMGDVGRYYAGHLALLSSSDGVTWTDEGLVTEEDLRGKLLLWGDALYVSSSAGQLAAPATARQGVLNHISLTAVTQIGLRHGGQATTMELQLRGRADLAAVLAPGLRVTFQLGALVNGTPELYPQFVGIVDQPLLTYGRGIAEQEWLCRGPLRALIGETAYRPPTTLEWPGRRWFHSNFLVQDTAVLALAVLSGYWLADKQAVTAGWEAYMVCRSRGQAVIPQTWTTAYLYLRADVQVSSTCLLTFWAQGDDSAADQNYWRAGLARDPTTGLWEWVCEQVAAGKVTRFYSASATWSTATRGQIWLELAPGVCRINWVQGASGGQIDFGLFDLPYPVLGSAPERWRAGLYLDVNVVTGQASQDDLQAEVLTTAAPGVYRVRIDHAGDPDTYAVSTDNGATWTLQGQACTTYGASIADGVHVAFTAVTGHRVGDYWTITAPVTASFVYDVSAVGGSCATNVGEILQAIGALAGCPITLDASATYVAGLADDAYPSLATCDVWVDCPQLTGDGLEFVDANFQIYFSYGDVVIAGEQWLNAYAAATDLRFRVVADFQCVAVYLNDRLIAGRWLPLPDVGGIVKPLGQAVLTVPSLNWPVEETAWDYNQPGSALLQRILDRRRVYLYERPTGVVLATQARERFDLLNGAAPCDGYTSYRRLLARHAYNVDARGIVGIYGIIGAGTVGSRVYLLDATAAQYGVRSQTSDNPWVLTEVDALTEATRQRDDYLRQLETYEFSGLLDPGMEIGGRFDAQVTTLAGPVTWSGVVDRYQYDLALQDNRLNWQASWAAARVLTATAGPIGLYVTGDDEPPTRDGAGNNFDEVYFGA